MHSQTIELYTIFELAIACHFYFCQLFDFFLVHSIHPSNLSQSSIVSFIRISTLKYFFWQILQGSFSCKKMSSKNYFQFFLCLQHNFQDIVFYYWKMSGSHAGFRISHGVSAIDAIAYQLSNFTSEFFLRKKSCRDSSSTLILCGFFYDFSMTLST